MPLARAPRPATLAEVYASAHPTESVSSCVSKAAGSTPPPATGYAAPSYTIHTIQKRRTPADAKSAPFYAKLVKVSAAREGDNSSVYLKEGLFETNFTLDLAKLESELSEIGDPDTEERRIGGLFAINTLLQLWTPGTPRVYFLMSFGLAERNRLAEQEHCDDLIRAYKLTLGLAEEIIDQVALKEYGPAASPKAAQDLLEQASPPSEMML